MRLSRFCRLAAANRLCDDKSNDDISLLNFYSQTKRASATQSLKSVGLDNSVWFLKMRVSYSVQDNQVQSSQQEYVFAAELFKLKFKPCFLGFTLIGKC